MDSNQYVADEDEMNYSCRVSGKQLKFFFFSFFSCGEREGGGGEGRRYFNFKFGFIKERVNF